MISSFKVRRRNITKTISPEKVILKSINHSFLELEKKLFLCSREECQAYAYKTNATCKAKI